MKAMTVYITDSAKQYESSNAEKKILLEIAVIRLSNFLSPEQILDLNAQNNSSEVFAGEAYIDALENLLSKLPLQEIAPIAFHEHKPAYEQVYSLLFHRLSQYGKYRFQLEAWIKSFRNFFPGEATLAFDLGHLYSWFAVAAKETSGFIQAYIRPEKQASAVVRSGIKNLLQTPVRLLRQKTRINPDKTKVMIVSYNIAHHLAIFANYVRHTLENTPHEIHVLIMSNDMNSPENLAEALFGENERVFVHSFSDFRTTSFRSAGKALKQISQQLSELSFLNADMYFTNSSRNYSWMQTAFDSIRPAVGLIVNLSETGRILSDIAHVRNIPTIQVDYGLFSDHDLMNSRISFSARAVVSDAVKEVWERRGDTSLQRIPIGYCKLDDATPAEKLLPEKPAFFLDNGLDPEQPTIFFASSWSLPGEAYDTEKKEIIRSLSTLCSRNGYNLIVKQHPLETDTSPQSLIAGVPNQRTFKHPEISLEKAIVYSDVITTQGSSVVLEALYYGKMPVFLGFGPFKQLILAGMTNRDEVSYFNDFDRFERYVQSLLADPAAKEANERLVREKVSHILYKTDGKAYLRLFELTEELRAKKRQNG
jgi:hypothetical protein